MTYGAAGKYDAAYTYGLERIEVEDIDEIRPESQDPLYYLHDGLGSTNYLVKPDGNIRDHYRYDAFGKPAPGNAKLSEDGRINLNNTFGYTGEMWDEETNLLYLRARYYEPETGRFLSRDTYEGELENPLSRNLYAYVLNNPVNYNDPTGNMSWTQVDDLKDGVLSSFGDTLRQIRSMFTWDTARGLWDFGKAIRDGRVSLKEIGSAIVSSTFGPITYLINNTKPVFAGNPTDSQVYRYGKELGTVLQQVAGSGAALKIVSRFAPKLIGFLKKLPSRFSKSTGNIYDGVRIINKQYAGKIYKLGGALAKKYPNGVKFTKAGFPDFSPYAKVRVIVNGLKGTSTDFAAANKAAGFKSTPNGYTWHHVEDGRTMLLVPTELHSAVGHTGGASLLRQGMVP